MTMRSTRSCSQDESRPGRATRTSSTSSGKAAWRQSGAGGPTVTGSSGISEIAGVFTADLAGVLISASIAPALQALRLPDKDQRHQHIDAHAAVLREKDFAEGIDEAHQQ